MAASEVREIARNSAPWTNIPTHTGGGDSANVMLEVLLMLSRVRRGRSGEAAEASGFGRHQAPIDRNRLTSSTMNDEAEQHTAPSHIRGKYGSILLPCLTMSVNKLNNN
jgi:hypothetical protein